MLKKWGENILGTRNICSYFIGLETGPPHEVEKKWPPLSVSKMGLRKRRGILKISFLRSGLKKISDITIQVSHLTILIQTKFSTGAIVFFNSGYRGGLIPKDTKTLKYNLDSIFVLFVVFLFVLFVVKEFFSNRTGRNFSGNLSSF